MSRSAGTAGDRPPRTTLVRPDASLLVPWRAAVDEFGDAPIHGSGIWDLTDADRRALTGPGFAALVAWLLAQADPVTPVAADRVHCTFFWITDGPVGPSCEVLGFLALRHSLNDFLLTEGGHIGYAVRPSRRREGHASRALALSLARAAELGLDRVLVTCDEDNVASARTILADGGVYEDSRRGRRRYWIPTGAHG